MRGFFFFFGIRNFDIWKRKKRLFIDLEHRHE